MSLHHIRLLLILLTLAKPALSLSPMELAEGAAKLSPPQRELYLKLADDLRCPTCTGLSSLQSDAPFSLQIRKAVLDQVMAGKSRSEIMDFFRERYGDWILREPPKRGFHLLAWIVPIAAVLLGLSGLWLGIWRRRRQNQTFGVRSTHKIIAEFEQELRRERATPSP